MKVHRLKYLVLLAALIAGPLVLVPRSHALDDGDGNQLDNQLAQSLAQAGFTGTIQSSLQRRLGRQLNPDLANIGRLLWFDTITGLNDDNTCAGCHSPTAGFGDTQSIAIGIQNNGIVGPDRHGPRNERRAPMAANTGFFRNLMWNSRFSSLSGDPFDNSQGFLFPPPEVLSLSGEPTLLAAQAFIPPTERTEVAGFTFPGDNFAIRAEVLRRLNAIPAYRTLFGRVFPAVQQGGQITFDMFGRAIAEFEFTLIFVDAPIDRFARGQHSALSEDQKKGALLFFGQARCVECHKVSGQSNEMFSDFEDHVIGIPQIAPFNTNNSFDGPGANEDFGRENITNDPNDRYKFRTSPIRNVAIQPTFFHNGAFTRLDDAVRHHLDVFQSARNYDPTRQHLAADLLNTRGPIEPVLARVDPILQTPIHLSDQQFEWLVDFVTNGLLDSSARPENLRHLIPKSVPSGRAVLVFEFPNGGD